MATRLPRPSDGDVDHGWKLLVGTTVTFCFAGIAVGLRIVARLRHARMGWDDHLMLFALVQALVATILDFVAADWGLGRHLYFLTPHQRSQQQYYSLLAQVFCINALTFAKVSICFLYLRVLRGTSQKGLRWVCYITAFLVFAVNTVVIISFYTQCNPSRKAWNPIVPGSCWKPPAEISLVLLQGSFSALTDFFLSALPLLLFKELQISKKNKVILCGLMGFGMVTGIFALIRTIEASTNLHTPPTDLSFTSILGLTWAGMERNIAIMIASIPAMRPLAEPFIRLASRALSYRQKLTSQQRSYEMENPGSFKKMAGQSNSHTGTGHSESRGKPNGNLQNLSTSEERILSSGAYEHV